MIPDQKKDYTEKIPLSPMPYYDKTSDVMKDNLGPEGLLFTTNSKSYIGDNKDDIDNNIYMSPNNSLHEDNNIFEYGQDRKEDENEKFYDNVYSIDENDNKTIANEKEEPKEKKNKIYNGDFDNGLIKTEKQEDFQKENEKIEKMFEIKKGKKWKNKEKYDDENEIVNPRKDILEKIEKEVGYKCDYVIKCIKQKKINYNLAKSGGFSDKKNNHENNKNLNNSFENKAKKDNIDSNLKNENNFENSEKKEQLKKEKLAKLGKLFKNLEKENNIINSIKEQFLDWTNKQEENSKQKKDNITENELIKKNEEK